MTTPGGGALAAFGTLSLENLLILVRIAETAERYDDMCQFVKELVQRKCAEGQDLDVEERNLLSVAYKNVVGSKRASWRTLSSQDDAEEAIMAKYRGNVETELEATCNEVIALLNDHLLKAVKDKNDETEVFYLKMAGDYYRYLSEFRPDEEGYKKNADGFYGRAMDKAKANLEETHPTRLGLALNYSVCYYEILKEPEKACDLAKTSFDAAIEKLDQLEDANYKDSTLIMQLLRDNLTLWTSEQEDS